MNDTNRLFAQGIFDGVHTGHGALLSRVREKAAALDAGPTAYTFDAQPGIRSTGAGTPMTATSEKTPHSVSRPSR